MKKELIRYIKKNNLIHKGDTIVVGVSGGADSVCLLVLLHELQEEWELNLHVIHVHHGIRGEEAERDARYVQKLAEKFGLPFSLVKEDIPRLAKQWGKTEEETGRLVRYAAFQEYSETIGGALIAVAHHRNDQAETVLFHLFRGSGARGLSGMPVKRENIIRPLLFATHKEIIDYLKEHNISYCNDSTNEKNDYARNRIRNEILPLAEKINTRTVTHIAAAAEKIGAWKDYVEKKGEEAFCRILSDCERLPIPEFLKEEAVIQDEILRRIFEYWIPNAKDISEHHYEQVRELIHSESGKCVQLPNFLIVEHEYQELHFCRREKKSSLLPAGEKKEEVIYQKGEQDTKKVFACEGKRITFEVKRREELPAKFPEKDYTKWFDYDMIKDGLILRNPTEGDFFLLDFGGRKKVSRYYMDEKIPKSQRAEQLVLAEGSHVLWAVPGRISAAYKITKETKMVLVVTMERE